MNDMSGMVILVTGATSGIGRASALRFAKAGAVVIAAGRNRTAGEDVVGEINKAGGIGWFLEMDVTERFNIERTVKLIKERFGKLDGVFANAGVFDLQSFEEITEEGSNKCFSTNLWGVINTIQETLPLLKQSGGAILNNASICGLDGYVDEWVIYSSIKAAIIKITKQLAKKYAGLVRVNAVCPGNVKTSICEWVDYEELARRLPSKRVGMPEDIAAAANFLLSKDASYITGAVLTVDGGESL